MRALVVTYCPRESRSRTLQLAEHAAGVLDGRRILLERLDLTKNVPDLLTSERLNAYYRRNYAGEKMASDEAVSLKTMDRMTDQLMSADILVLAFPMYNFSQPAIVKAWFDSVMQKGRTWDFMATGYAGLLKGRGALVITTSGGTYEGERAGMEHSLSLSRVQLGFMGYKVEAVTGEGINRSPDKEVAILSDARNKIDAAIGRLIV